MYLRDRLGNSVKEEQGKQSAHLFHLFRAPDIASLLFLFFDTGNKGEIEFEDFARAMCFLTKSSFEDKLKCECACNCLLIFIALAPNYARDSTYRCIPHF